MRILILGHNGFLGSELITLNEKKLLYDFEIIDRSRWPLDEFKDLVTKNNCSIIVNCISYLNEEDYDGMNSIHYELPKWLSTISNKKIINFTSDILNSNFQDSSLYFQVKKKAEEIRAKNLINVRTSFFGFSNHKNNILTKLSLNKDKVIRANLDWYYSGVSTVTIYSKLKTFVEFNGLNKQKIIFSSNCITQFEFYKCLQKEFTLDKVILPGNSGQVKSRCANSDIKLETIQQQIAQLKLYKIPKSI